MEKHTTYNNTCQPSSAPVADSNTYPQSPPLNSDSNTPRPSGVLKTIDSVELLDKRFKRQDFIVQSLLKPGLAVLAGSPKIGKSWMVLQLCLQIAKGEPFLGLDTESGGVLYIALEDSPARIQERILCMTDAASHNFRVTTSCSPLGETLREEITRFCVGFPRVKLVVIDTFQKIREQRGEMSYSNDYTEVSYLKRIADENHVCILLVHHTRKMADSDCFNEISGTNGIAGSADTLMVLKKGKRTDNKAVMTCTGRDIDDREMELVFNRELCSWQVISDSANGKEQRLPEDMEQLVEFVRTLGEGFVGSNTELCDSFNRYAKLDLTPSIFKRRLNRWRYLLEDRGVAFDSFRENDGSRAIAILYSRKMDKSIPQTDTDA